MMAVASLMTMLAIFLLGPGVASFGLVQRSVNERSTPGASTGSMGDCKPAFPGWFAIGT